MSDDDEDAVQDDRIDWLIERVEHRPIMFKQDRINKMRIHEESTCVRPPPRPAFVNSVKTRRDTTSVLSRGGRRA
eukprot:COSAG02_NODE_685_length_18484_cov_49.605330_2_plen_75_part_00